MVAIVGLLRANSPSSSFRPAEFISASSLVLSFLHPLLSGRSRPGCRVNQERRELSLSLDGFLSGRDFCLASLDLHFVGDPELNFYSIRNPKKLNILQMCWVLWLKMVCTLSIGPTLPLLQVSLQSEHSKCTIWNGSGFGALWFILCLVLYNLWVNTCCHPFSYLKIFFSYLEKVGTTYGSLPLIPWWFLILGRLICCCTILC